MDDWNLGLGTLREGVISKLADLLDNPKCGWRQLADAVNEQPRFRCSEKELMSCSLQVLSAKGSPSRLLLAMLADRACSLGFLLQCLKKMEHREAVQYLTATVMEQIRITVQPQSQRVPEGGRVVLSCQATGPLGLGYQWFKGKEEVLNGSTPELVLSPLTVNQQGYYICRVHQGENFVFSQWAQVCVARSGGSSAGSSSGFVLSSVSGLRITQQPRHMAIAEGDALSLECRAEGNPPPQYQWYHNKQPLPPANRPSLKIPCVTTADRGQYSCRVYNLYHEVWSDQVHVEIGPGFDCGDSWVENTEGFTLTASRQLSRFYATDKVALLMGNMNYQHHRQLRAPMADVHELTNLLRQLDFKVVSLLDLNRQEMHSAVTEFLLLLDRGVYGLLYFAGHGYENYGNSFMVPIDAPASYTSEHCLWVQDVLQRMQERETGLNVFLLDMCRKRNLNDDIIPQPGPLKVTANIVFGYATCVDAEAYEVNKDDLSNGIFINFLKQRLMEDEKVTVMLDRVAEDMGQCEITRGRQALELRSNLSERRALTDRIQCSDCPAATSARNLQWSIAHVLPESRYLQFECGVKVQLGFAAEFSNIMIIYTRILEQPHDIVSCSAQLSDFSEGVDVDLKLTNQESPRDAGSLLFTFDAAARPELPSLYTRLRALQRLQKELTFTVCLHYQYSSMDEEVQEKQTVSVGKPLVAKLNLYQPRLPRSFSASSSSDLHTFSLPESSSFPEGLQSSIPASETSSLGSASTCWSYYSPPGEVHGSARHVNVPEETFSPEFLERDAPQPLSAESKSLPHDHLEDLSFQFHAKQNFHSC
ncbi:MALT paracaspase 2 [Megalops cyprinoides]|uniref:MALT paracaspase 2 n=1 Tax=Megalops cyprinoides TaxID=118141 RepID=UPI001863CAD1|nr:MALT paracaspase 2 [Megalops cyprinoides]XP_036376556.1 MALT paracaspase 2 [Megalops cyprinoides]